MLSRRVRDLSLLTREGALDINALAYGLYYHTDRCGRRTRTGAFAYAAAQRKRGSSLPPPKSTPYFAALR